jgi:hypothetical protein
VFWSKQHAKLATGLLEFFGIDVMHNESEVVKEPGRGGASKKIGAQLT